VHKTPTNKLLAATVIASACTCLLGCGVGAADPSAAGGGGGAGASGSAGKGSGDAAAGGTAGAGASGAAGVSGEAGADSGADVPDPWSDLLFEERFESDNPLASPLVMDIQHAKLAHSMQYTSSLAFEGSRSARFELRASDPEVASGTRAEVVMQPATGRDRWYAFAAYFPAGAWGYDQHAEVITQWHSFPDEHLGESWSSPATKLLVHKGRLRFDVGYNDAPDSNVLLGDVHYDLGPVIENVWREIVIHIYHSHAADGLVQVWLDGIKLVDHAGGNAFNDVQLPFWKFGIYKWGWNGSNTTDVDQRVLYVDHVRVAGN
jgi:hypothetical protein